MTNQTNPVTTKFGEIPTMPTDEEWEALDQYHASYGYDEKAEKMYNALREKEKDFARFLLHEDTKEERWAQVVRRLKGIALRKSQNASLLLW